MNRVYNNNILAMLLPTCMPVLVVFAVYIEQQENDTEPI